MNAQTHSGFAETMRRFGIVPTAPVVPQSGKFARFPIEGDPDRTQSGWARLSEDGRVLSFGSHRTGSKGKWQIPGAQRTQLPPADRAAIVQRIANQRKQEELVARQARALWDKCSKANYWHPVLRTLGFGLYPHGVREDGKTILVPMLDADFRLWNLTMIYQTGITRPIKGGRRGGLFWAHAIVDRTGRPSDGPLVIADRYEAASSIHAPTCLPVVSSMTEGNLGDVARTMRRMFPRREIIVAAYDDRHVDACPRLRAAVTAAHSISARVATPMPLNWRSDGGRGFDRLEVGDLVERIDAAELIGGDA